jgi:hypothetical protein
MIESAPKTFMPIQTPDLHRVSCCKFSGSHQAVVMQLSDIHITVVKDSSGCHYSIAGKTSRIIIKSPGSIKAVAHHAVFR